MNSFTLSGLLCLSLISLLLVTIRRPAPLTTMMSFLKSSAYSTDLASNPVMDSLILADEAPEDDAHTPDNRGEDINQDGWEQDQWES